MMFGIQWVLPDKVASLLFGWHNWLGKHSSNIWNLVPTCMMWSVRKECNSCTFEESVRSIEQLKSLLLPTLYDWSQTWGFTNCSSILISNYLRSSNWFACIFFRVLYVHHREHRVFFSFAIKFYYLSPKIKICFSFFLDWCIYILSFEKTFYIPHLIEKECVLGCCWSILDRS